LHFFKMDSCIGSTRVAQALMEKIHKESYPLSVQLSIFNKPMVIRAQHEGGLPDSREVTRRWNAESGAWSVGVGFPVPNSGADRWPGHLVLIVERRWLWDLSIDQANRPQWGINFTTPPVLAVTEGFLRGRERVAEMWQDCLLIYDAKPNDKSFRESNNWDMDVNFVRRHKPIEDIIAEMREPLDPLEELRRNI